MTKNSEISEKVLKIYISYTVGFLKSQKKVNETCFLSKMRFLTKFKIRPGI